MQLDNSLWLVGSGGMAAAYAKVLLAQERAFAVIGRGSASAEAFEQNTGVSVRQGGLSDAIATQGAPERAIIATPIGNLAAHARELIEAGTKALLIEKPAALHSSEIRDLAEMAGKAGADVFIAYNRRFFTSVQHVRQMIEEDGGLLSFTFDFTEITERVLSRERPEEVLSRWLLANSSHVIDLAFHLGGIPKDWQAFTHGSLDWHPSAAVFTGAGITEKDAAFSYAANWSGPGRWGVELVTAKRRLILRPMERVAVVNAGSMDEEHPDFDYSLDTDYKPGIYLQTQAFLAGDSASLCDVSEQLDMMKVYETIAAYPAS